MSRRNKEKQSEFNPFIDILTCLAGVMILIIILVVIEAKESKILIPTPIKDSNKIKQSIFVEVSEDGEFFQIPKQELEMLAAAKLKEINDEVGGNQLKMLSRLSNARAESNDYYIDLRGYLSGHLIIKKKPGAQGQTMEEIVSFQSSDWFSQMLAGLDKERQMLVFLIRATDQSYQAFRRARATAHLQDTTVAYEVFPPKDELTFGLGGQASIPQ